MDTVEIDFLMKNNRFTKPFFRGVYSCDKLPKKIFKKTPFCIVVNTDPSYMPGTHWLAFWIERNPKCIEMLDSFGVAPNPRFYSFLRKYSNRVMYSNIQFQSDTSMVCGLYCLLFLYLKAKKGAFTDFTTMLRKSDGKFNDCKIIKLFGKIFLKNKNKHETRLRKRFNQKCCALIDRR
jgi:Adenovirus endoprotease